MVYYDSRYHFTLILPKISKLISPHPRFRVSMEMVANGQVPSGGPPLNTQKNLKMDLFNNLVHFRVILRMGLGIQIISDLPPTNFLLFQPPHRAQSLIRLIFSEITPKTAFWQLWTSLQAVCEAGGAR